MNMRQGKQVHTAHVSMKNQCTYDKENQCKYDKETQCTMYL